ncbi:glycosyltransferase [Chlorobium phaeovibrioides]|uniref:glycosyltransferase family 2 protein n=1 Tax=Chlorobium phaeovibrioides TaxID=1094 RepID=UPI000F8227B3|nr:glycosyltransferase family 2 protein [Chlorobium phaeovibrioides]RTY33554.1 glycosyltransferase [Chlorobium phaeovibrioides]
MNKKPAISIITAVFNGARTLRNTIESIVPQLTDEIEYIIIDGGSTDGTQYLIRSYAEHFAYWISEPDGGIYDAWNKGLAHALGQFICFVGADDVLMPGVLETYLANIRQRPEIEYISSRVALGESDGRIIGQAWRWDHFRRRMTVAHVGSLHNRNLYERLGQYDTSYRIVGDYEFLLRAGSSLNTGFIDEVTVIMGAGGVSNKFISLALKETMRAKSSQNSSSALMIRFDWYVARSKQLIRWLSV